jgi:class 3 adenylate cyclase
VAELPTGTVTFLFTDIEGSTRLWSERPDAMRLALARHDALVRAAIETNRGFVFKTRTCQKSSPRLLEDPTSRSLES